MASQHQHGAGDHGHAEHHSHHAHDDAATRGKAFAIAVGLNLAFVIVEFAFGIASNSTALTADAGHNLSDVLGLLLAWCAAALSRRAPNERYTYGMRSTSILAAVANAVLLLVACGAIAWEAIGRFEQPPQVVGSTVTVVAAVGILVNGLSAWLFAKGRDGDLNVRAAFLHMAADAGISLGVVITGLAMMRTGWMWLDPLASLAVVMIVVYGTWGLLRESIELALHAAPQRVDLAAVESYLASVTGVTAVHDLHVWGMSTTECALTVHLVIPGGYPGDAFVDGIAEELRHRFGIQHATLQVELGTTVHVCGLSPA